MAGEEPAEDAPNHAGVLAGEIRQTLSGGMTGSSSFAALAQAFSDSA